MPELPEVETLARQLRRSVVGLTIRDTTVHRADVVQGGHRKRDLFAGERVERVLRHGKQLALVSDSGRIICVHLGMTGQMLIVSHSARIPEPSHVHITWRLGPRADPIGRMVFRDPRRFGGLWTFADERALRDGRWDRLGPDALTMGPRQLHRALQTSHSPVKARLLDQHAIAGVGNIYADEALHRARIDPRTPASEIDRSRIDLLNGSIRKVLQSAIKARGSTLRDYRDARGEPGGFQASHAVYSRGGLLCTTCGSVLESAVVAQRTTVWCPSCQRA